MIEWAPFSPKALDFLQNSDARLNILHGSVRSSKTINCTVRWLNYLETGPKGDLAMFGRTTATLSRNVLNDLFDIVGPKNYKWVNRQQGELILLDRRIYCFGANNEEAESKIRGATFAGALCDEVNLYPKSVFNQLMARLSVKGAKCFCNCNPDSPYHWFYTDYIINDAIEDKKIWHFTMDDNLSLDPDYVKSLKQEYVGVWYDRMILGKWVAAEGRIYDMFDPKIHVCDCMKKIQELGLNMKTGRLYVGCDYGTSSVTTWGLYVRFPDGHVFKLKEFYYNAVKEGTQRTNAEFLQMFNVWLGDANPWAVYIDPAASSWKIELRKAGYRVLDCNNTVLEGIRVVSTSLSEQKYFIDKSCVDTIKEYSSYVWDPKAQLKGEDKPLKVHDHTCDCDRYVIYTLSLGGLSGVYGGK